MCYLFDLLVSPVMNYASETWDYTVLDNNDSLELVHSKFALVNAPNLAVYGELGRTPLLIHRKILTVKYWCRLSIDDGLPMFPKEPYLLAKNNNLKWYKSLVNIMKSTDLDQMCDHLIIHPNLLINELKQRLNNLFIQNWNKQLQSTTGKLRLLNMILFMSHIWSSLIILGIL